MLLVTTDQAPPPPPPPPHVCATYGKWTSEERGKYGTTAVFAPRQPQVMTMMRLRLHGSISGFGYLATNY